MKLEITTHKNFVSAEIKSITTDVADGTEDGVLGFSVMNAGTLQNVLEFAKGSEVVVNETSADVDFRVESNGATHMLFVDGGNNGVFVNTDNSSGNLDGASFGVAGGVTFLQTGNTDNLTLLTTDADDNIGPNLRLYRNSSSPANADNLATIDFEGRNNNSQDVVYAQIVSQINDVADGAEDGILSLKAMIAGTSREGIRFSDGGGCI